MRSCAGLPGHCERFHNATLTDPGGVDGRQRSSVSVMIGSTVPWLSEAEMDGEHVAEDEIKIFSSLF